MPDELAASNFMRALRRESVDKTPVWLMRQAGRYMPEYREVRSRFGFLELCKRSDLAAEVTVTAVEKLGVDAAIIFADILLPLEPMGVGLAYEKGDGPVIHRPVRSAADVANLKPFDVEDSLSFVLESIRLARRGLKGNVPLIGFAGAPFTLASYLVEGGASRHFIRTKELMYREPATWHKLAGQLAKMTARYLNAQVDAGAQCVQLFDSWVGCLSVDDYAEYVMPHVATIISDLAAGTPVIHFGTGTAHLLELMRKAGGDVIGLDWRVGLAEAWSRLGPDVGVQGNLDPVALFGPSPEIKRRVQNILDQAGGRPGHIFNLGHGVLPDTDVANVKLVVDLVAELSRNQSR